jgi:glucosamine--fructose-6-phosphate aminotransferase (isomerizing)
MSSIIDEKYLIRVPNNHELTHHIANIIPMQLLAYHLAVKKGYSVDQPRNLAKSVTVSD